MAEICLKIPDDPELRQEILEAIQTKTGKPIPELGAQKIAYVKAYLIDDLRFLWRSRRMGKKAQEIISNPADPSQAWTGE